MAPKKQSPKTSLKLAQIGVAADWDGICFCPHVIVTCQRDSGSVYRIGHGDHGISRIEWMVYIGRRPDFEGIINCL